MWRTILLRRAYAGVFQSVLQKGDPGFSKFPPSELPLLVNQCRSFSKPPRYRNPPPPVKPEEPLPEPPPFSSDEIDFIGELASSCAGDSRNEVLDGVGTLDNSPELPEAPKITDEWEQEVEVDDDTEDVEDLDPVPYFPPVQKSLKLSGGPGVDNMKLLSETKSALLNEEAAQAMPQNATTLLENNANLERILAAWGQAVLPTPITGPMPLHELANRSTKLKELVKLGVDLYKIAGRHGDLERLMALDWDHQIKPQIRFLVDCGIEPDRLADFFSRNTALLWTDKDDIQVRLNYLEAKQFSPEQIKKIVNGGAFWLTLSTKELDARLGFIQKTYKLQGSDVRSVASSYPALVSTPKWSVFVDTTKLMDREFGFTGWERKQLLLTAPQCYLHPSVLRKAFDFCHNQIGFTHTQLVQHGRLLVNRVSTMQPRYKFLKFLKRDIFNVKDPLYISPDWLWKGTVEEFCEEAAKTSVEDFENYLRYSDHT